MAEESDWGALQEAAERLGERADESGAPQDGLHNAGLRPDAFEGKFEGKRAERADTEDEDGPVDDGDRPGGRPPVRKAAGWGAEEDEASASGAGSASPEEGKTSEHADAKKSKRRSAAREGFLSSLDEPSADDAASLSRNKHLAKEAEDDDGGNIMIIPDLDEDQEEDLQLQVAEAPANVRSVQTLRELDRQINGLQIPNASGDDQRLDLSILSRVLVPRDRLEEPDEPWDFEQLLEQVSQEMRRQKESTEAFERSRAESTSAPVVEEEPVSSS